MADFIKLVYVPAALADSTLVVQACRAGGIGVLDAELETEASGVFEQLDRIALKTKGNFGLRLVAIDDTLASGIADRVQKGLGWLILDADRLSAGKRQIAALRRAGVKVLAVIRTLGWPDKSLESLVDGLVLKGNEAGGFVGESASFVMVQRWLKQTSLPLYVHGGLTPQVAAACSAAGLAGGVLDSQLLLLDDVRLPESVRSLLASLAGSETIGVGNGEIGEYFRVLLRPGHQVARNFVNAGEGQDFEGLRRLVAGKINWKDPRNGLLPIGQDVCFAASWSKQYRNLAGVFDAIDAAIKNNLPLAIAAKTIARKAPLAAALGVEIPVVQGPMTRVSDVAGFAQAVAEGGGLPMIAFALLKGEPLHKVLEETQRLLGGRPWGIGLLGFAPQALLDEQLAAATAFKPSYAIVAGGRPDQVVKLEEAGIPSFLHVPSASLIPLFLQEGARRFIFEGRECGGHIGPLSSFVLWSTMVDRLLVELGGGKVPGEQVQLLFAGGIHDAVSSAMVQVLVAPLVAKGVKIGILMGSAYLFTKEIVSSGAIVPMFQQEVIECEQTANLESGPGHASRCGYTPFAKEFFRKRVELREKKVPADEARQVLDDLIMGRLRIASKGQNRSGLNGKLVTLDQNEQREQGMYMLGQVATLRSGVTDIAALHREVTDDAVALLESRLAERAQPEPVQDAPADVAIIGVASVLPKANSVAEFWDNILNRVDAITEIPSHRWDWRLYFSEDRQARDKIYSKWGGFLDDLVFDPIRYGMPPKAIEAVDPMQLMALEVANRTLIDAGYKDRPFDRSRASVIIGASGGTGDVGSQYGLRAELPRFQGALPDAVAARLPEWTEDSFAGILVNVVAGRIANRLNFGGVNFTTDAACASSLTAVYQGVSELIAGRSDMVLAGGVDTVQGPFGYLCFSKTQALSPRGRCSSFDAAGDGIVISEGIVMVALKRLADAERDGDRIYAVIKGAGGSSDGNSKGMTAPLPAGQVRAMRRAYAQAGFGPESVGMFEAHGTGTVAGDTAELESTTMLMHLSGAPPHQAIIGSVKTNIGHTKAAAGVAGLLKATLALHHKVLPPHRNVTVPNAVLQAPDSPLYLPDEALPWVTAGDERRRAAVSAFGFGGTNFHLVLEEYTGEYRDWLRPAPAQAWPVELLLWHGGDRQELIARLAAVRDGLAVAGQLVLRDLAASLARQWQEAPRPGGETLAIVAKDVVELGAKLARALAWLRGEAESLQPGIYHGSGKTEGKLAVLFSGQGSQYPRMLREAALYFSTVGDALSKADGELNAHFARRFGPGVRLSHFIFPRASYDEAAKAAAKQALTSTDVAQPALAAVEAGLWQWLRKLGLKPDMLAGHSFGEFSALYASGAFDFASLMALSSARGAFIVDAAKAGGSELGTMAAVQGQRAEVEKAIAPIAGVIVANHNAPLQSIISGSHAGVQSAIAELSRLGFEVSEIPVAAAFHSEFVKPAQGKLAELIGTTAWQPGSIPVYSNTSAKPHSADVGETKALMAEHLVRPVEFVAQVEAMYQDGARVFLEVGPKSVLSRLTSKILEGRPHSAVAIDDGGMAGTLGALAQLLCAGIDLDVMQLFEGRGCRLGNPDDLPSLHHMEIVPKHAWLLNGSGARRAGEPTRQIGVRLEDVSSAPPVIEMVSAGARQETKQEPSAEPMRPAAQFASGARAVRSTKVATATSHTGGYPMEQRAVRPFPAGDPAVMAEYFDVMRQFLESQERVISRYLGDPNSRTERLPSRSVRGDHALSIQLPSEPAPAQIPVSRPAVAPALPSKPVAAAAPAPRPAPAPAPAASAAPPRAAVAAKPVVAPAAAAAQAKAEDHGAEIVFGEDKLTDMLFSIVEEKTGYSRDMVGLNQNLESDLGIDSIKRVEVVGAMLQRLPESYRKQLAPNRSKLNTQTTLGGMIGMLTSVKVNGVASGPFDYAGAGVTAVAVDGRPPRHVMLAEEESIDARARRQLTLGHFVVTEDRLGVAAELGKLLSKRGCTVDVVARDQLVDDEVLARWCAAAAGGGVAGIVHLAQLGAEGLSADAGLDSWRAQLQFGEKSLFRLVHDLGGRFVEGAHVLSASLLGGYFGRRDAAAEPLYLQAGAVGMLKSLREERPDLRAKAVDLDAAQAAPAIAASLLAELELDGGRQEVGYPKGRRTVFHTVEAAVDASADKAQPASKEDLRELVVLATGGARGITAEVLRELALPGNILVLTARNALPQPESPELTPLLSADDLRKHFINQFRSGTAQFKLADIGRKVQAVLAARELLSNIEDFRAHGAVVEYHAVDVTREDDMRELIAGIYQRHGRIDGIVHGAGIIEDKLLADKAGDSWSRVVETKVLGLALLQKYLRPDGLKFFCVFSSVAGRYGNSGQSDYATANELMNRLCCQLNQRWQGRVNVMALCWGPWGPTKFGVGMVTPETEAKFAEKGVALVTAESGRRLFKDEITRADHSQIEIICGVGPWEKQEATVGVVHLQDAQAPSEAGAGERLVLPLLGEVVVSALPKGEQVVNLRLDAHHPYLQHHRIDGVPVLPAAGALEMVAQAARRLWPGWKVVEVRDFRLMKGIELKEPSRHLSVVISPPVYGSSEGFEANAVLQSEQESGRSLIHYKCTLCFAQQLPAPVQHERRGKYSAKHLAVAKAYAEWLFHGPCFQVIENIAGMSEEGVAAQVRTTHPTEWQPASSSAQDRWMFDPAVIDAAAQMAILWARAFRDETSLPTKFGRVIRYSETFPERLYMDFERLPSDDPSQVCANVCFYDKNNNVVIMIEEMQCIADAALNRLGGTAKALSNSLFG